MKKVFEFVATIREGNLQRQKFFHDRHIRGKQFQLLDKVLVRNDQPKVAVSKKLKFKYDGFYTVVAILSSVEGSEENDLYRIKPEGRGRTKVVNGSKLKRAFGPYIKDSIDLNSRRTIERYVDKIIEEVATGAVPNNNTRNEDAMIETETTEPTKQNETKIIGR